MRHKITDIELMFLIGLSCSMPIKTWECYVILDFSHIQLFNPDKPYAGELSERFLNHINRLGSALI